MSERSDLGNVLRIWLEDGPSTMPDRVVDVVADRIDRQRQRRGWRLLWRLKPMNRTVTLAAAAVAVVVVAFVGWNLLPGIGGTGGRPSPSPSSPSPTAAPGVSPPEIVDGPVSAGRYLNIQNGVRFELDIPAGWTSIAGGWLESPAGLAAPNGLGIAFLRPSGLFSDPCHWDVAGTGAWPQPADVAVGPTAADLATALAEQEAYTSTAPIDIELAANSGKLVELTFPPELDPTTCDVMTGAADGVYWPFGPSPDEGNLYTQGPGQIWHVRILDLSAGRFVIVVDDYAGTTDATRNAATQILDSITFRT